MAHGDDPDSATTSFLSYSGPAATLDAKFAAFRKADDKINVLEAFEKEDLDSEKPKTTVGNPEHDHRTVGLLGRLKRLE
jgi:hypothetical protein